MIVHLLKYGRTACMMDGPPCDWPEGHRWARTWKGVTCDDCLLGRKLIKTYTISADRKSITCLICGAVSTDPKAVKQHTCSGCGVSHDDLWPPARLACIKSWANSIKLEAQVNKTGRKWQTVSSFRLGGSENTARAVAWFTAMLAKYRPAKKMRVRVVTKS